MLESYVTPLITSYLSKYIRNIKPSDLQLSFWGGDVVLYNLELRPDAIEESLKDLVPFNLKSGCVKKLTMHIPWTAIGSEEITLSLESVECSVKLKNLKMSDSTTTKSNTSTPLNTTPTTTLPDDQSQQPPGYVQGLMNRIVNNIKINVQNLVVKVIEEESDMEMSFTVKSVQWYTTNSNWEAEYVYTDSSQGAFSICKRCIVTNMTICLDQIGSGGQVEIYEEPFVPRCSFECRWMSQYEAGSLVENLIDLLAENIEFSVTEAQFSLFLHLLDWLLAMYYSYKKLKGRDLDLDSVGSERGGGRTKEEEEADKPQVGSETTTPSPLLSPESTDETGWGTWMLSFVSTTGDDPGAAKPAKPVSRPGLSLNLAVKSITIDLKINQRRRNPVFFTSLKRVSAQVMRVEFLGCLAHINRVPSTTLLGVSTGVMSVNGWVGGTCPCRLSLKQNQRHHHYDNFEETLMHVYSLGTTLGSSTDINGLVANTFFETNVDASPSQSLSPKDWLQWNERYQAVWFSYEYYDKKEPEREEEVCQERVVIGEQNLVVSPDVVHRVWFFVNGFLKSLEAVPLVSQGMVVIGDPLAKTNLEVTSSTARILLTVNCHSVSTTSSLPAKPSDHSTPTRLSGVVIFYDHLNINVTMPMYSGNATLLNSQELLVNAKCCELRVGSHLWFSTGSGASDLVTGALSLENTNLGFSVPEVLVNMYNMYKGTVEEDERYFQVQASSVRLNIDYNELTTYFVLYQTWNWDSVNLTHPSVSSSLRPSLPHDGRASHVLSMQICDCSFELKNSFTSTTYSFSSNCIKLFVIFPSGDDRLHMITLPIASCPTNTRQFVLSSQCSVPFDSLDSSGGQSAEKAVEVYFAREEKDSGGLSAQLKISGGLLLIEPSLLTFLNLALEGLAQLSSVLAPEETVVPAVEVTFSANRPEPEGVSSADPYMSSVVSSPPVPLPVPDEVKVQVEDEMNEDEDGMKEKDRLWGLLSLINETKFNIKTDHFVVVSALSCQPHDYFTLLKGHTPQTPHDMLKSLVDNGHLLLLVLPALTVHTTDSHVYPLYTTKLPGTSSWQASLTDGTLYSVETTGGTPRYLVHPFSVEVSVAPVRSSLVLSGVSGYGVHLDVDLIHISLSKEVLLTTRQMVSAVVDSVSPLFKSEEVLNKTVPTSLETLKPPSRPSSALSSSHISNLQHSIYHPPSDSSISAFSNNGTHPSLWLQCTLTKLVMELASDQLGTEVDSEKSRGEYIRKDELLGEPGSGTVYKYESEELSFSLDKQERGLNCQLKVSSLEGDLYHLPDQHGCIHQSRNTTDGMFKKIFSSKCTVLSQQVLQRVEFMSGSSGPVQSPVWETRSPGSTTTCSLASRGSFIVVDIKSHFQSHRATQVKLQVQMFESVVSAPLVKRVMEVLEGISGGTEKPVGGPKNDSSSETTTISAWPQLDVKLDCFKVLFPTTSSSSSSSGLIVDVSGGIVVRSDLNYPVSRMEVNASALRRLSIMASEKRIPPLPGYEIQVFALHLLGLSVEGKERGYTHTMPGSVSVFPVLTTTGIEAQLSPALQWPLNSTTHVDRTYATGNSLEICFKSDIVVSLGISQAAYMLKLFLDFRHLLESTQPHISDPDPHEHYTPPAPPHHLLITTKSVHMEYCQGSFPSGRDSIHLTVFDPVVMVTRTLSSVSVKCLVFNIESKYCSGNVTGDHTPLLESLPASHTPTDTGHISNVVCIEVEQSLDRENCSVRAQFDRSLKISLSPDLLTLFDRILTDLSLTLCPILTASQSSHPSHSTQHSMHTIPQTVDVHVDLDCGLSQHSLLTKMEVNIKTKQFVLQLNCAQSSSPQPLDDDTHGNGLSCIIVSFNGLSLTLPAMESLTDKGYHYYGNQEFNALKSVIQCNGLCIKCVSHVTIGHMTNLLLFPANFRCTIVHHLQGESKYHSGHTLVTVLSDPVQLSGGLRTLETINTILTSYSEVTKQFLKSLECLTGSGGVNDVSGQTGTKKDDHQRVLVVADSRGAMFKDDLRRGDLLFNTEDVQSRLFPLPGEVRFFTGDAHFPPYMIWQYKEPRCVTRVQVLPVPLGILTHEDTPTDLSVHCELAYFDELDRVFVTVGSLYLSETSPASWDHSGEESDLPEKGKEDEEGPKETHARVWCLTIVGLEWTEEEEEEGEFINRADFPLTDLPASSVLSPLVLAGCTTVDSIINPDKLTYLSVGVIMKKTSVSLLNQPRDNTTAQYFNGYCVQNDLSQEQFSLLELVVDGLSMQWTLHKDSSKTGKVRGAISLSVQDFRDLTIREVIHPAGVSLNIVSKQATAVSLSLEPCLIRVSPTLIHTITVGTRSLSIEVQDTPSLSNDGSSPSTTLPPLRSIFATYIICNKTTTDLHIGQESTIEWSVLPKGSCVGYHWYTHCIDQQQLRLAVVTGHGNSWTWSSPFSIDQEGTREICVGGGGRSIFFYAEVTRLSGIQEQVIISGLWTVSSHLPYPLAISVVQTIPDPALAPQCENSSGEVFRILKPNSELSITPVDGDSLKVAATNADTTNQTTSDDDWFEISLKDWTEKQQPMSLKVSSPNGSVATSHLWYSIVVSRSVKEKFQGDPIKIVFSPLFNFINNLPHDLVVTAEANDTATGGTSTMFSLCGHGNHTPVFNLQHNSWYLIRLSAVEGVASPPFPLSTSIINQLPVYDETECGKWPYSKCCNHRPSSGIGRNRDVSIKTISLPVSQNGESIPVHVELRREEVGGTVLVTVSPDMLLINETDLELKLGVVYGREIRMEKGSEKATAVVRRDEEFRLSVCLNGTCLHSPPVSVRTPNLKDKKWKYKKINLWNDKISSEIIMEFSLHKNTLIGTLKPSHIMINRTPHKLFISAILHRSLSSSSPDIEPINGYVMSLEPSTSSPITAWQLKAARGERVAQLLSITTGCTGKEDWSLPLLLNFVRISFNLPLCADNDTSASPIPVSCLLTTHEMDGINYIVIDSDPSPRLLVRNQCPYSLQIREADTHWLHSHSQTLYPHSKITYDPPSLAMQYPLIKECAESEDEVQNMKFKQLSNLRFQFRLHDDHTTLWSGGLKLPSSEGIDVSVTIPGYGTVNVLLTRKGGATEISLVPVEDEGTTEDESIAAAHSPCHTESSDECNHNSTLSIDALFSQLILLLDSEGPTVIQPVLTLASDKARVKVHCTSLLNRASLEMDSLQIDSSFDSVSAVVLCPRVLHDPPVRLIKPRLPPFITASVEIVKCGQERIMDSFTISIQPMTLQLNDILIVKLGDVLQSYRPPIVPHSAAVVGTTASCTLVQMEPLEVLAEAERDRHPVQLQQLSIGPIAIFLTAHMSRVISLSCDDSPLHFSPILLTETYTSMSDLSQSLAIRYITGLVMQGGWVLGSLDLIGSPSLLINTLQTGLYNFLSLPYEGLTRGPGFFVLGLGHGVSSLLGNVSGGVLRAVTNFATSVATNMERFSLDPDHTSYQLSLRQGQRSSNLGSSLFLGVSSFGMSLMSAMAGVVDQPMQMIHQSESQDIGSYTQGMLAGMGKGLLGLVTKPIGGAFQLVSQTGQGILNTSGLVRKPNVKHSLLHMHCQTTKRNVLVSSVDKYQRLLQAKHFSDKKTVEAIQTGLLRLSARGTICLPAGSVYNCLVLLTGEKVHVFDTEQDLLLVSFNIYEYDCLEGGKERVPGKKNTENTSSSSDRLTLRIHQTQLEQGPQQHATFKRDLIRKKQKVATVESTLKEHRDENVDNVRGGDDDDTLFPLGGRVVLLVPHVSSNVKGVYNDPNPQVQKYLDMTIKESSRSPLNPSLDEVTLHREEMYTLTFTDDVGGVFITLYHYSKSII